MTGNNTFTTTPFIFTDELVTKKVKYITIPQSKIMITDGMNKFLIAFNGFSLQFLYALNETIDSEKNTEERTRLILALSSDNETPEINKIKNINAQMMRCAIDKIRMCLIIES